MLTHSKWKDQSNDVNISQCNDTSLLEPKSHLSWLERSVQRMFMLLPTDQRPSPQLALRF